MTWPVSPCLLQRKTTNHPASPGQPRQGMTAMQYFSRHGQMSSPPPGSGITRLRNENPGAAKLNRDDDTACPAYVDSVVTARVPGQLAPAIIRPRDQVEAVLEQSLQEMGGEGRTALAWQWALTRARPSPVTLSMPPGRTPSREEILAEAGAEPEGSTAPPGVPADFCDQLGEARRVLAWLSGGSDEYRSMMTTAAGRRRPRRLLPHRRHHRTSPRLRDPRPARL